MARIDSCRLTVSWDEPTCCLLLLGLLHGGNRWRGILDSIFIVSTRPLSALSSNQARTRFPLALSAVSSAHRWMSRRMSEENEEVTTYPTSSLSPSLCP